MTPRLFLLDNHDSFTFNLAQYFEELGASVTVRRNDRVQPGWVLERGFEAVVVSPGPGRPERAGVTPELVRAVAGRLPLLGVCLGHQAIAQAFGGRIVTAARLRHGKASLVRHDGRGIFRGIPAPFASGRYHSLTVDPESFPTALRVSAWTDGGTIMALRHPSMPIDGVQFHPESVLTPAGKRLMLAFLHRAAVWNAAARAA